MPRLHTTATGERGSLIVFCHGLFGQGRNWTGVAKALSDEHRTLLVDLPQHGRSPWSESFDYLEVADQVAELLSDDDPVTLVGHSLGGKVAMVLALRAPEKVHRLCVVDIAPVDYGGTREFAGYVEAMRGLDLTAIGRRADADEAMSEAVPDRTVRDFLLQNLRRDTEAGGWRWQANLEVLGDELDEISGWPEDRLADTPPYDGPVLWVAGEDSGYIRPEHDEAMRRWFPTHRRVVVKGAGHWVHAQQPAVFVEVLRRFAAQEPDTDHQG
jgi:pimeloyl-ACP methyl ester carboxylesterase